MSATTAKMKKISFTDIAELQSLVKGFESYDLPASQWTHTAHQAVAFWYLISYPFDEAVTRIRSGIQNYNLAQGGQNTPDSGYHETITIFWMEIVRHYLATAKLENHLIYLLNELIAQHDKDTPLRYFSRDLLFSPEARQRWVAPDLQPLPSQ